MTRRSALSGMPLLVGLLVVTFAIAADVAHEAWTTSVVQQATAERAARDFVRLSATSVAHDAQSAIAVALRAFFAPLGARETQLRVVPDARVLARAAAEVPASYYFRVGVADRDLNVAGAESPADDEQRWLRDSMSRFGAEARRRGWDTALLYSVVAGRPRIVAYTVRTNGSREYVYGLTSDASSFVAAAVAPAVKRSRVDAAGASHAASYDSLMRSLVLAPDGSSLYEASARSPARRVTMVPAAGHESYVPAVAPPSAAMLAADTVALGAQYGDLRVGVALMTSEADAFAGQAVPRSRYLVLFGMLLLMAGLIVVAVRQIQREHEIARLRADLTAGVSHELRTPLAQILLFGETLMLERTRSRAERRAAAEVIVREARRLIHLVENALHFTRVDRQLFEPSSETIDLAATTREILVSFAPLAWAAKVNIREMIGEATPAAMNAGAYRQILLTLLENAVRYGPASQTITVTVERRAGAARLVVEDEGPGIPLPDRERVWSPFVRLTRTSPSAPGTGIGLAVVRDLAHRYGGRAWVERSDSGGARFCVELPAGTGRVLRGA